MLHSRAKCAPAPPQDLAAGMGRFIPDSRGFVAARDLGGFHFAAYLLVLLVRSCTSLCFLYAASMVWKDDVLGSVTLGFLCIASTLLHFVQNVWPRLPVSSPRVETTCLASALDSSAIAAVAAAVASSSAVWTVCTVASVMYASFLPMILEGLWARRLLRIAAAGVAAVSTFYRVPPSERGAFVVQCACTGLLFPCVVASRPRLLLNTVFASAWHAAAARGILACLGLRPR